MSDAQQAYCEFVDAADAATYRPWDSLLGQIYLGNQTFREVMQERIEERPRSAEHPAPQRELERSAASVAEAVSKHFGCANEARRSSHRSDALVRTAYAVTCIESGVTLRAAGEVMGVTAAAVSRMRGRSERTAAADAAYAQRVEAIRAELKLKVKM